MPADQTRRLGRALRFVVRRGHEADDKNPPRSIARRGLIADNFGRRSVSSFSAHESRCLARLEPEPAARRRRERIERVAVALRTAPRGCSEAIVTGIEL